MAGHEISEHTAGRRQLNPSDRSRYSVVRLTVTRNRNGTGTVSLIVRDVRGGVLKDTRLAAAVIGLEEGSLASRDPLAAIQQALGEIASRSLPG